jgi:hypothetical protein
MFPTLPFIPNPTPIWGFSTLSNSHQELPTRQPQSSKQFKQDKMLGYILSGRERTGWDKSWILGCFFVFGLLVVLVVGVLAAVGAWFIAPHLLRFLYEAAKRKLSEMRAKRAEKVLLDVEAAGVREQAQPGLTGDAPPPYVRSDPPPQDWNVVPARAGVAMGQEEPSELHEVPLSPFLHIVCLFTHG